MPNPQVRDVHIDALLSRVSVAYTNGAYIARMIAPSCPVDKMSDYYAIFGKESFSRHSKGTVRAIGGRARTVDWSMSTDAYGCKPHALKQYLPMDVERNADTPINPRQRVTKNVTDQLLLDEEYALSAVVFSGTYITQNTTLAGTSQWSDAAGGDPLSAVETGKAAVFGSIGVEPNVAIMGKQVWDVLKNHPDIIARVVYTQKGILTEDLVAEVLGLQKIIVGKTLYNSAKEGQTVSLSHVWGKHVLLAYVEPTPARERPTLAYTFCFQDNQTRAWFDADRKSTAIEVEGIYDQKLVDPKAGYLILAAVA